LKFSDDDRNVLRDVLQGARRPRPESYAQWRLEGCQHPLGWMSADRLEHFRSALPAGAPLHRVGDAYVWRAASLNVIERGAALQSVAVRLRDAGLIAGWRDEAYSCWGYREDAWPYAESELFRLERSAFRFFGLRSHAAHVHGLTQDGRMWCGTRSLNKATDPGRLDNLAAGGIPAGEGPEHCAIRELIEEAGLVRSLESLTAPRFEVVTERLEPEGWHSERLFVFSVAVGPDEQPSNQDGEVSHFDAFDAAEVIRLIQTDLFTADAACAIAVTFAR
jgi:8-oxo-dGTP pyrophosphatase MutT (NUDIX family)